MSNPGPRSARTLAHFLVAQEVIVHIFNGLEFMGAVFARNGDLGMCSIEAVEEIYVFELVDPAPKSENVIGCWREECDRRLVLPEEGIDV